jgi:predicted membrane-bound spermidine synthase
MRALVLLFFFVSGVCGLLYEVVWIRVAGTVIGNTTFAIGTVVGVFMGGLALGAWAGDGRPTDARAQRSSGSTASSRAASPSRPSRCRCC